MKNSRKVFVTTSVMALAILIIGGVYFYSNSRHLAQTSKEIINLTTANDGAVENPAEKDSYEECVAGGGKDYPVSYNTLKRCVLNNRVYMQTCTSNDEYFVISKDKSDVVGSNILIKKKSSSNQNILCDYAVKKGDLEIKDEYANYVLALENNFLILDEGTGPDPRGLVIYDLNTRKKIYQDTYSKPVDVKNNTVYYWTGTTTPVTSQNCPDSKKWEGEGLGPAIDAYVSLNLSTLGKTEQGQYRCSPRQ